MTGDTKKENLDAYQPIISVKFALNPYHFHVNESAIDA